MYYVDVGKGVKELICRVTEHLEQDDIDGMIECLKKMTERPDDIISSMPKFDCDEVLLYGNEKVTVYFIATTPKILYPPHEHGMVAVSALYKGTETHVFYDRNGENVVDVTLEPAISTNPYLEFEAKVPEAGEFKFTWYDDDGSVYEESKKIAIE